MSVADYIGPTGLANFNLDTALRRHIFMALDYCAGDMKWAAVELGISGSTLYRWCRQWGWQPDPSIHVSPHKRAADTRSAKKWSTHVSQVELEQLKEMERQLVADMEQAGKRRRFGGDSHSASPDGADRVRADGQASGHCLEART